MIDYDELMQEAISTKALIDLFQQNRNNINKSVDGNKLSASALKIASRIETDNKNIKILAALCLLAIASNLEPAPAQKIITKALGIIA